jgi:hypothetical protein
MSWCHRNVVPTGNRVAFFLKAGGCQELFDREMCKLYDLGIPIFDDGKYYTYSGVARFMPFAHWGHNNKGSSSNFLTVGSTTGLLHTVNFSDLL